MSLLVRLATALTLCVGLTACVADSVYAPDDVVQRAAYLPPVQPGAATVTLLTMISNSNGSGGHSALVIDGAQRLVFDPAGSWHHPSVPERNDVLYGMQPQLFGYYMDYHARESYHVVVQEVDVTPDVAAQLATAVQQAGPVPRAQCSRSISTILAQTPGFEAVSQGWFPARMMAQFENIPGVRTTRVYDDDSDDNLELLQAQARAAYSQQISAELAAD